jgi:hypothetical protein
MSGMSLDRVKALFNTWKSDVNERYGTARFTSDDRDEIVEDLALIFFESGVDQETALTFKRHVIDFLVTREGKKNSGKYAGWADNVTVDYDKAITVAYQGQRPLVLNIDNWPIITLWVKNEFPEIENTDLIREAATEGSPLNMKFQKEVLFQPLTNWPEYLRNELTKNP